MIKWIVLGLVLGLSHQADGFEQSQLNEFADKLQVTYQLIDSKPTQCPNEQAQCYFSTLSLSLPYDLKGADWQIYFSQLMPIYSMQSDSFIISHVNGDLHRLEAKASFKGFTKNTTYVISFYSQESQITESEYMPNYIATAKGLSARNISSTAIKLDADTGLEIQPYLVDFEGLNNHQVSERDQTPWMNANYLFETQTKPLKSTALGVIPQVKHLTINDDSKLIDLRQGLIFTEHADFKEQLTAASSRLGVFGVTFKPMGINLNILKDDKIIGEEGYELTVKKTGITIKSGTAAGAFYAMQTLAGLISVESAILPELTIIDAPRYPFRGLHIDVARNFRSKAFILKTIEQMAAYKLNKLHLHLADDEGWRLAIAGLPELTNIGAARCLDLTEQSCLLPQLGAGVDRDAKVNGYYTSDDYKDILLAAKKHFIEVIPSLDMPGHSRAAIVAMEQRFNHYAALNQFELANQYRLIDPLDTTVYSSIQHYDDNTINVCQDSSFAFVKKVLEEMQVLHDQVGVPLKVYHIGADETAGAWLNSPACLALKQSQPELSDFNGYFIEKVSEFLAQKNIEVAAWSDGLNSTQQSKMPKKVQANAWAMLSDNGHKVAHQHANLGWQVVISAPDVTYFDFPYQAHPKEPGNHWASRAIDSRKVFEFMPDNLPAHAEIWPSVLGQPYEADDSESMLKPGVSFYGLQGHLWSEMIRSDQQAHYMLFPRLLALAERAWHRAPWELAYDYQGKKYHKSSGYFDKQQAFEREQDWQRFASLLAYKELPKLAQAGVFYRIPTVAASIDQQGYLHAFTSIDGFDIQYQQKNGPWLLYQENIKVTGAVRVRAKDIATGRKGRMLSVK